MTDCLCLPKGKDGVIRLASVAIWKMTRTQHSHIIGHNANQNKQKMLPEYWFTIQHQKKKKKILIKMYVITSTAKVQYLLYTHKYSKTSHVTRSLIYWSINKIRGPGSTIYVLSCNFSQYLSNYTTTQDTSNMNTTKKRKRKNIYVILHL